MGLFDKLRDWILGGPAYPASGGPRGGHEPAPFFGEPPAPKKKAKRPFKKRNAEPFPGRRAAGPTRPPRTPRYAKKTHRPRPSVQPIVLPHKPYALARCTCNPQTGERGRYYDARVGGDDGRLERFGLPRMYVPDDLAQFLHVPLKTLAWLSDFHGRAREENVRKKQHYHFKWLRKKSGGQRLIEAPKPLLRHCQQRVLREILDRVHPHPAAHGFRRGRSIISNARPHAGKYLIVKADLENFYPSIRLGRVIAVFRGMGYNLEIARLLARLCTSVLPRNAPSPSGGCRAKLRDVYGGRHLPQGAPTSPALANLAAYALDARLAGLARAFDMQYTRYADDLTFSGYESHAKGKTLTVLIRYLRAIIKSERYGFNRKKRRIVRRGKRQIVTGLTVNEKPNVSRKEFEKLKAILTNCSRHGAPSQNREGRADFRAHLAGKIAFVRSVNPPKAERLQRIFDRVTQWH